MPPSTPNDEAGFKPASRPSTPNDELPIFKTHPDHIARREWVWCLTYPAATRLQKQGRAESKEEAAEAVRRGLDEALRWHAERGQPLLLRQDGESDTPHLDWMRPPVRIVVGRDVPWPEGWGGGQ